MTQTETTILVHLQHQFEVCASKICGIQITGAQIHIQSQHVDIIVQKIPSFPLARRIAVQFAKLNDGWYSKTFYQVSNDSFFFQWRTVPLPERSGSLEILRAIEVMLRIKHRLSPNSSLDLEDLYSTCDTRSAGTMISLLSLLGYQVTIETEDKLYLTSLTIGVPPVSRFSLGESITLSLAQSFLEMFE